MKTLKDSKTIWHQCKHGQIDQQKKIETKISHIHTHASHTHTHTQAYTYTHTIYDKDDT